MRWFCFTDGVLHVCAGRGGRDPRSDDPDRRSPRGPEVVALRSIMGCHREWVRGPIAGGYAYGSKVRHADCVQRIDFGPRQLAPEEMLNDAQMWRLGELRTELLTLVCERLRVACKAAGLWGAATPDAMQLMQMGAGQQLAQHYERRERWQDGVASIAWSSLPSEADARGDAWSLVLERGASRKDVQSVTLPLPPGAAFVLTGVAQGSTRRCAARTTGHKSCGCCWTHGMACLPADALADRQSLTLRVLADSEDEDEEQDQEAAAAEEEKE